MNRNSLLKKMLTGAILGLLLISFFLLNATSDPSWSKFWMLRPLIIVPLAGAGAGLCYHFLLKFGHEHKWNKSLLVILGIIGHLIALWMGTIVGLDGTLWN